MKRACGVTLEFATAAKRREIGNLLEAYRGAVNFYIGSLWRRRGGLNKETYDRLRSSRLSARYRSSALKQALDIVISTRKSAKVLGRYVSRPIFRGAAILDAKFITVEAGRSSFDLAVRLSTLRKGCRITIPTKRTASVNKWLTQPLAKFVQGCALSETGIVLWINIPDLPAKRTGDVLGVDVGMAKLLAASNGKFHGTDFRAIRDKVKRKRSGSKAKRRAIRERDQYIARVCKELPWADIRAIGIEDLKGLKSGKKKGRGKSFRKAAAPWSYRQVRQRIENLAQANRVRVVAVDPRGTSRTCPICKTEDPLNRKGEKFSCIECLYSDDADHVGSLNILSKTLAALGSLESPGQKGECHG